jgi:hypothetical protein
MATVTSLYTITDNRITRIAIEIGLADNGRIEVTAGLCLSEETPVVATIKGTDSRMSLLPLPDLGRGLQMIIDLARDSGDRRWGRPDYRWRLRHRHRCPVDRARRSPSSTIRTCGLRFSARMVAARSLAARIGDRLRAVAARIVAWARGLGLWRLTRLHALAFACNAFCSF